MASKQNYTPDEQAEIARVLEYFSSADGGEKYFSPMEQHYQSDISSLATEEALETPEAKAEPAPAEEGVGEGAEGPGSFLDEMGDIEGSGDPDRMGGLDALADLESSTPSGDAFAEDLGDLGDTGTGAEAGTGGLEGLDDLVAPEGPAPAPSGDAAVAGDLGDLGDLGDTGIGAEAGAGGLEGLEDLGAPESPAPPLEGDTSAAGAAAGDSSELFDLGDLVTPEESPAPPLAEEVAPPPPLTSPAELVTDTGGADTDSLGMGLDAPPLSDTSPIGDDLASSPDLGGGGMDMGSGLDMGGDLSSDLSAPDIAQLGERAQAEMGIGDEFSDQELANIRSALTSYPPAVKKAIIEAVVNEQIALSEQRLLMNMLINSAPVEDLADFVEARLGHRPSLEAARYTKDGLEIIYADELSPEAVAKRKRRNRIVLSTAALAFIGIVGIFGTLSISRWFHVKDLYEMGLEELRRAQDTFSPAERKKYKQSAESYFRKALLEDGNRYDPEYLKRYGLAYMKARFYEEAFTKLFGRAKPSYASLRERTRIPLIRRKEGSPWRRPLGKGTQFTDQSGQTRTVEAAGAYMVERLREGEAQAQTLINLGRFHSNIARDFIRKGRYKNDRLAMDYYRSVLTLLNQPQNARALAAIGDIFYNQKRFIEASRQYRKIVEYEPLSVLGNARLLHSYIELAKRSNDPRAALAKHREIRKLGIEEELPIYLLTKLAGFYGQLNAEDVLIKYQIDPVDKLTNQNLEDNARHLLDLAFDKTESRDYEEIDGSRYAEGFYQRGLFLSRQKENRRALKQFEKAHHYDPLHYLAINEMGNYYKNIRDFERSGEYYAKAIEIHKQFIPFAGRRPEDETLMEGDIAQIYYNAGSLIFIRYAGFSNQKDAGFPGTRLYPFRAYKVDQAQVTLRRQRLAQAKEYFEEAQALQIKDPQSLVQLQYWSGWIDYMNADFNSAIQEWEAIEDPLQNQDVALLMAKANSYYYTGQLRNSLGHYLKAKSDLEHRGALIKTKNSLSLNEKERQMLLIALYNNLGVIYEKVSQELPASQSQGRQSQRFKELEKDALLHYWKSLEAARQAKLDNEIARTNVQLAFKARSQKREPLLDDWLLPVLPSFKHKF